MLPVGSLLTIDQVQRSPSSTKVGMRNLQSDMSKIAGYSNLHFACDPGLNPWVTEAQLERLDTNRRQFPFATTSPPVQQTNRTCCFLYVQYVMDSLSTAAKSGQKCQGTKRSREH